MHTCFSGDSEAKPQDMIAAAAGLSLSGITLTDHLDWDFCRIPHMFDLDLPSYSTTMDELKATLSTDTFKIYKGIELGLQTHLADRHKELLSKYNFDYIIGSIHQIDGEDPYYDDFWDNRGYDEAYAKVFELTIDNITAFHDFDALGHLDYISRYAKRVARSRGEGEETASLNYKAHSQRIDTILNLLIKYDIALEINTAPFRHGFDEPNPSIEIQKRYHDLGGRLITIGADAHKPVDIAAGFDTIIKDLLNCGFRSYFIYVNRSPIEIPLQ